MVCGEGVCLSDPHPWVPVFSVCSGFPPESPLCSAQPCWCPRTLIQAAANVPSAPEASWLGLRCDCWQRSVPSASASLESGSLSTPTHASPCWLQPQLLCRVRGLGTHCPAAPGPPASKQLHLKDKGQGGTRFLCGWEPGDRPVLPARRHHCCQQTGSSPQTWGWEQASVHGLGDSWASSRLDWGH